MKASVTETSNAPNPLLATPQSVVKERLRSMQRVWSAMTKFISSQCANGRTVDLPLAGKFKRQSEQANQ